MAADRNWTSAFSRFAAMLHSLARRSNRRAHAERIRTAHLSGRLAPEIDITDLEIVQLVHDLRNQLMVMTSCVNAIRDGVPDRRADRLRELQQSAERAVLLINSVLLDRRPQPSERVVVDVNEAVRDIAATLAHLQDDAVRLRLDLWAEPLGVRAEPGDLERVLLNLVLNAYDAMPDGGVLTIETALADAPRPIEGTRSGPYARLRITDTGGGMTAEVRDRIFDAFFTTKKNGTGLGLRSVAFTLHQLQGRIAVESEHGRGTSVTVMLPLADEATILSFSASGQPHDSRD
jgi:two-component system cell cycle sensor histidine kinase/response regulator CckA